jgi:hypothetical protein
MWESQRDFHIGWEAGFMAFHAFHTLSFHGLLFAQQMLDKPICRHQCNVLHSPREAHRYSSLVIECALAILRESKAFLTDKCF